MRKVIKDAFERFYDLAFPPAVRWKRTVNKSAKHYRYPSPASERMNLEEKGFDYKTAYRDSVYHIRYDEEYSKEDQINYTVVDPIVETPVQKLVRLGKITQAESKDEAKVAAATKAYEEYHGIPITQKVLHDDNDSEVLQSLFQNKFSRESLAYLVRNQFESTNYINSRYPVEQDYHDLYHPRVSDMKHLDLTSHDPVIRQSQIDLHWLNEKIAKQAEKEGGPKSFHGDARFWHAIDNVNSIENIQLVQAAITDNVSRRQTTALPSQEDVDLKEGGTVQNPTGQKQVE